MIVCAGQDLSRYLVTNVLGRTRCWGDNGEHGVNWRITIDLEGLQRAVAWKSVKRSPCCASLSMFGVWISPP